MSNPDINSRYTAHFTGTVQGVGFRPFVYNLAERFRLAGWVLNNSAGVEIEAEGSREAVEAFVVALRDEAPPLSRIESLEARDAPPHGYDRFQIRHSEKVLQRHISSTNQNADACGKLFQGKGLHQIIICPGIKTGYL